MAGFRSLDEQAIRDELGRRMRDRPGECAQCGSDRLTIKEAASDFPGYEHRLVRCQRCGLVVHVEHELDEAKAVVRSTVVGASGLRDAWARFTPDK
jgi:hypothetical protein